MCIGLGYLSLWNVNGQMRCDETRSGEWGWGYKNLGVLELVLLGLYT